MNALAPITDYTAYNSALAMSLADKLFFVDRIPDEVSCFIDYGCGDGALLWETMKRRHGRPGSWKGRFIGYDIDASQIEAANKRVSYDPAFDFTCSDVNLRRLVEEAKGEGYKTCLVLSSVAHEVLSQGRTFAQFWAEVYALGADFVVIRDMAVGDGLRSSKTPLRWYQSAFVHQGEGDAETIAKALSFEERWGTLKNFENFMHFLLKAVHPIEDWAREVGENYLPMSAQCWVNSTTIGSGYDLRHFSHDVNPWLQDAWVRDFGIFVSVPTHVKLILERRIP